MIIPKPNVGEDLPMFVLLGVNRLLAFGSSVVIVNGANQVEHVKKLYGLPIDRIAYVPLNPRTTAVKWGSRENSEEPGMVLSLAVPTRIRGWSTLSRLNLSSPVRFLTHGLSSQVMAGSWNVAVR
jgi:hypothetical protein